MAVISPDTFDPLRRYVGVRLQQGVPIVDADENEREDCRKFELRAFLKWFVGDGVPEGNDGFRIEGTSLSNDFMIRSGESGEAQPEGLRRVGRCLVDGLDVMIAQDLKYSDQPLHPSQPGAAARAAAWGVPLLPQLTTPAGIQVLLVYLDVWERLVTPMEDPSLLHPGLGTESCVRLKREWVVRLHDSEASGFEPPPGHSYYVLAHLFRRGGDAFVHPKDVQDKRETGLLMPPTTLIDDTLGVPAYSYRRGEGRPSISLREAINALLRGEMPTTPETTLAPHAAHDAISRGGMFFTPQGNLIATWESGRKGGVPQVFGARWHPVTGSYQLLQLSGDAQKHLQPYALPIHGSEEMLLLYQKWQPDNSSSIFLKRDFFEKLGPSTPETQVALTASTALSSPFAVQFWEYDQVMLFWHHWHQPSQTGSWQFRRYGMSSRSFIGGAVQLSATSAPAPTDTFHFHAASDLNNNLWAAFRTGTTQIQTVYLPAGSNNPTAALSILLGNSGESNAHPYIVTDPQATSWFFWVKGFNQSVGSIQYRRFLGATQAWEGTTATTVPGTETGVNYGPVAVADPDGTIWLFWYRAPSFHSPSRIMYARYSPLTGQWSTPRQIVSAVHSDSSPFVMAGPDSALWLFWQRTNASVGELLYRRIITKL